jgi:hypothetical protein
MHSRKESEAPASRRRRAERQNQQGVVEQVIGSRAQPWIEGLAITPIPFNANDTGYVITIPQASARAPDQAPDRKYYKRQNFQSVPMEDYETRDALRRGGIGQLGRGTPGQRGQLVFGIRCSWRRGSTRVPVMGLPRAARCEAAGCRLAFESTTAAAHFCCVSSAPITHFAMWASLQRRVTLNHQC